MKDRNDILPVGYDGKGMLDWKALSLRQKIAFKFRRAFSRENYVVARLWFRRRVVDAAFLLPKSWRLTQSERDDMDAYREEKVFQRVGKNPTLAKQVPMATRKTRPETRPATIDEVREFALKQDRLAAKTGLNRPADPFPPVVGGVHD